MPASRTVCSISRPTRLSDRWASRGRFCHSLCAKKSDQSRCAQSATNAPTHAQGRSDRAIHGQSRPRASRFPAQRQHRTTVFHHCQACPHARDQGSQSRSGATRPHIAGQQNCTVPQPAQIKGQGGYHGQNILRQHCFLLNRWVVLQGGHTTPIKTCK